MSRSLEILESVAPRAELIWASPREVLNLVQADSIGCHIITMTHDLIAKLDLLGKDLDAVLARDRADVPVATRCPPASTSERDAKALITGGAGFIGSTLADRLSADGVEVVIYDDLSSGRPRVHRGRVRAGRRRVRAGRRPRRRRSCDGRSRDATRCSTSPANADVRHGFDQPTARSRAEHDRHLRRARGDARRRRHAHRVLLHRLGLRRARGVPHARDVPVPGADVALRRLEARGRRADPGLRARVRLRRRSSFASSRSSASATRTGTSSTSAGACGRIPRACASSATAARRSRTSTSATASRR